MNSFSRRNFLSMMARSGAAAATAGVLPSLSSAQSKTRASDRPNVLFISVEDMRPELGCYGGAALTPHMDALAGRGSAFTRAYCQYPLCNPSRVSLMTGLYPGETHIYDLETSFRRYHPDVVALPQHFMNNGYTSIALSKLYHGSAATEDPASWSEPQWHATEARGKYLKYQKGPMWEAPDAPDDDLPDGVTTLRAIETLKRLKDKPFFLGVGMLASHLPFVSPKKYHELYPLDSIRVPDMSPPKDVPDIALSDWSYERNYQGMPKTGPVPPQQAAEIIRAYLASISYIDAQVGRLMATLDELGLRDNTIVLLYGDHGWTLGEHSLWGKHSLFELALRAPLIISAPGQANPGAKPAGLAEFVDIYPTLCELAGLELPGHLRGKSLTGLMNQPDAPGKPFTLSFKTTQLPPSAPTTAPAQPEGKQPKPVTSIGYSVRTDRYRYNEWFEFDPPRPQGDLGWKPADVAPMARELYDEQNDPGETVNIAGRPDCADLVKQLSALIPTA